MSLSESERRAIVSYRIEKARAAMDDIHKILPLEMWSIIANRMYYALYYAASALLINDGNRVGTHRGVIALFNLNYVKDGPLTREDGTLFANIFAFRQGSDYDDFIDATKEDVERYLPRVESLMGKIISMAENK